MLGLSIAGIVLYLPSLGLLALVASDIYDGMRNTRILVIVQLALALAVLVFSVVALARAPQKRVGIVAVVLSAITLALCLVIQGSLAIT
jgi:uncharacterized membrane protein YwaF